MSPYNKKKLRIKNVKFLYNNFFFLFTFKKGFFKKGFLKKVHLSSKHLHDLSYFSKNSFLQLVLSNKIILKNS